MRKNVLFLMFLCTGFMLSCKSEVPQTLPLEEEMLRGIDSHKLLKCENSGSDESIEYLESVYNKYDSFKLNELMYDSELLGSWSLKDSEGTAIKKEPKKKVRKMCSSNFFDIEKHNSYICYVYMDSSTIINTVGNNIYVSPSVYSSLIKKVILDGDKLYFYILKNDKWVLDPIHKGGKYFYTKDGYRTNKQNVYD